MSIPDQPYKRSARRWFTAFAQYGIIALVRLCLKVLISPSGNSFWYSFDVEHFRRPSSASGEIIFRGYVYVILTLEKCCRTISSLFEDRYIWLVFYRRILSLVVPYSEHRSLDGMAASLLRRSVLRALRTENRLTSIYVSPPQYNHPFQSVSQIELLAGGVFIFVVLGDGSTCLRNLETMETRVVSPPDASYLNTWIGYFMSHDDQRPDVVVTQRTNYRST